MINLVIHLGNTLYLVSYLTRDMLWLRALTCAGLVMGIVFFTCQPVPLYGCTVWHAVFLFINGIQIRRLVLDRRRLKLTEEQERVGEATFHDLSRDELLTLLSRVMCESTQKLRDLQKSCHQPLSNEEQVLRDIAFSHLSRNELLNLLTRRLLNSIARLNPARRKRQRSSECATTTNGPEATVA